MKADRRFIVLGADGRHVTVGRATPPSVAEVAEITAALRAAGATGAWLVEMVGGYWSKRRLYLTALEVLVPTGDWHAALDAFQARRSIALGAEIRAT